MRFGSADAATIEELPSCSTLLLRHLLPTTFVKLIGNESIPKERTPEYTDYN